MAVDHVAALRARDRDAAAVAAGARVIDTREHRASRWPTALDTGLPLRAVAIAARIVAAQETLHRSERRPRSGLTTNAVGAARVAAARALGRAWLTDEARRHDGTVDCWCPRVDRRPRVHRRTGVAADRVRRVAAENEHREEADRTHHAIMERRQRLREQAPGGAHAITRGSSQTCTSGGGLALCTLCRRVLCIRRSRRRNDRRRCPSPRSKPQTR